MTITVGTGGTMGGALRMARRWGVVMMVVVGAWVWAATPSYAAPREDGARGPSSDIAPAQLIQRQPVQNDGPRNIFSGDFEVEEGQVVNGDVTVYSGDVEVKERGHINGNLTVMSGNVKIDEDAVITGDLLAYSGDVELDGTIRGDLSSLSGNVRLDDAARIEGHLRVVSGALRRDEGATVLGNVIQGPSLRFPNAPSVPAPISRSNEPSFLSGVLALIGRLFMAALLTALAVLLVGGLYYAKPELIARTRATLREQLALSVVVGVGVNLTLLFLGLLLAITICLLPVALLPMLGLFAVNVVGWAVASQIVGERVVAISRQQAQPVVSLLVGAVALTGVVALLWALGGCFRPLAFLLMLAASSAGTGAVIVPWLNRRRGGGAPGSGGRVAPITPPPPPQGEMAARGVDPATVETDVAAPVDYVTAHEVNLAQAAAARSATPERMPEESPMETLLEPANSPEEPVELDAAAPVDYVTAQEINAAQHAAQRVADDFTRIKGVGPVFDGRLKAAGITTFAGLAATPAERIAEIIGWPVERVIRSEIVDQARALAERG